MIKLVHTDDHREVLAEAGTEYQMFEARNRPTQQVKSASEVITSDIVRSHMPPPGRFGVHAISMGSEEDFGFNRNGDSASRASLIAHHPTFVKYASIFREHRNKSAARQGIGDVVYEAYNPRMGRGELLLHIDIEKAPDLYKKASAGEELSWSMSMKLPYDRCSICDNKARTPMVYCDHLSSNLGRYIPGHRKYAYARNEDQVRFFDFSEVARRADRIASFLGYQFAGEQAKAAAADRIIGGAEWAAAAGLTDDRLRPLRAWDLPTLEKLAAAEQIIDENPRVFNGLTTAVPEPITKEAADRIAAHDFGGAAGAMAERGSLMDFTSFSQVITGRSADDLRTDPGFVDARQNRLPGLFRRMEKAGGCECGDAMELIEPDNLSCGYTGGRDSIDRIMKEVGRGLSMTDEDVSDRHLQITMTKIAAEATPVADPFFTSLAEAYGAYVVKAARQLLDRSDVTETVALPLIVLSCRNIR